MQVGCTALLLGLSLAGSAAAQDAPSGAFEKLRAGASYRAPLEAAARRSAVLQRAACPEATLRLDHVVEFFRTPVIDTAGVPQAGVWREGEIAAGCGALPRLNVLVVVKSPGLLAYATLLPGTTRADAKLQKDSVVNVTAAAAKLLDGCPDRYIADTVFLGREGVPATPALGQPWKEAWTLAACGRRADVTLHYTPDATSTGITASPNETLIR